MYQNLIQNVPLKMAVPGIHSPYSATLGKLLKLLLGKNKRIEKIFLVLGHNSEDI